MTKATNKPPVIIDLRALQPGYKAHFGRGIGRVTHELTRRLAEHGEDLNLVGLVQADLDQPDSSYMGNSPRITMKLPWPRNRILDRLLGQELILPLTTGKRKGLTHYLAHLDGPAWGGGPTVVTVHDLILARRAGEMAGGGPARKILRSLEARAARRAELVITVSSVTAEEVTSYLGVHPDKIRVIPSAAGEQFKPRRDPAPLSELKNKYGLRSGFILTVGGFDPRKNLPRLIRAWKALSPSVRAGNKLVLVGALDHESQVRPVLDEIKAQGVDDSVRLLGQVSDRELPLLYNLAAALVFPSFYEGFGLPALEAMSSGCPVLAAKVSALPEVIGEAGLYFNPAETKEISRAMEAGLTNPDLMARLREKGFRRAALFTWERAVAALTDVYREALRGLG